MRQAPVAVLFVAAIGCVTAPAPGRSLLETTWVVRSPDEGEPRLLAIVAGSNDEETLATINSICGWMKRTRDVHDRYSGVVVVASRDDPMAKASAALKNTITASPKPGAADQSEEANAYRNIARALEAMNNLAGKRPELNKCFFRTTDPKGVDFVVVSYSRMPPYDAGASYLFLHDKTSTRGFVPFVSRDPDENSRRFASIAFARPKEVLELEAEASISKPYRCELQQDEVSRDGSKPPICLYQPGTLVIRLRVPPSGFLGRGPAEIAEVSEWSIERVGSAETVPAKHDVTHRLRRLAGNTYRLDLHFTRAGRYKLEAVVRTDGVVREVPLPDVIARPQGLLLEPADPYLPALPHNESLDPQRIGFTITCRARFLTGCTSLVSAFTDKVVPTLRARRTMSAATTNAAITTIRDALATATSPFAEDDRSNTRWKTEIHRALTDDEIAIALVAGSDASNWWCTRLADRTAKRVTEFSGSAALVDRKRRWATSCAQTVSAAIDAMKPEANHAKYVLYALGGPVVLSELQKLGQIELDITSATAPALAISGGTAFTGGDERALISARVGEAELTRPVDLAIRQMPSMRAFTLRASVGPVFANREGYTAIQLAASVRAFFEVGRLYIEGTQVLEDGFPGRRRDATVVAAVHPWCYWSHTEKRWDSASPGSLFARLCRPVSIFELQGGRSLTEGALDRGWILGLNFNIPVPRPLVWSVGARAGIGTSDSVWFGVGTAF